MWSRARSFIIDFVLAGAAVSYASDAVQAWLLAHEIALAWILGALHIAMLPLLVTSVLIQGAPGAQHLDANKSSPLVIWSLVLYFGLGFLIPLVVAAETHVGAEFAVSTIIGPLLLTGVAVWIAIKIDKKTGYALSRKDAKRPRAFALTVSAVAWAYLLCLEAALILASRGHDVFSGAGTIACAFAGYVPIRIYLALAFDAGAVEVVVMALTFAHFLYRLSS